MTWYNKFKEAQIPHQHKLSPDEYHDISGGGSFRVDRQLHNKLDETEYELFPEHKPQTIVEVIEEMFPNAIPVESGSLGVAYEVGANKILKITTDKSEIAYANKAKLNQYPGIVTVYDTYFFTKDVHGIISDKVTTLTRTQKFLIDKIEDRLANKFNVPIAFRFYKAEHVNKVKDYVQQNEPKIISQYINLMEQLHSIPHGFVSNEAHIHNIGFDSQGDLVLFDLGQGFIDTDQLLLQHVASAKIATIPHQDKLDPEKYMQDNSGFRRVDRKINENTPETPNYELFPNAEIQPLNEYIEQMFPNAVPIDAGAHGIAYDLQDGRVLKLTTNDKEMIWANYYQMKPHPHVADVYDIIIIEDGVQGIILEKLAPLTEQEQNGVLEALELASDFPAVPNLEASRQQLLDGNIGVGPDHIIIQCLDAVISVMRDGNAAPDFHIGNLGRKQDGNLALLDLGAYTEYGHGIDKEIFEGQLSRMRQNMERQKENAWQRQKAG